MIRTVSIGRDTSAKIEARAGRVHIAMSVGFMPVTREVTAQEAFLIADALTLAAAEAEHQTCQLPS